MRFSGSLRRATTLVADVVNLSDKGELRDEAPLRDMADRTSKEAEPPDRLFTVKFAGDWKSGDCDGAIFH